MLGSEMFGSYNTDLRLRITYIISLIADCLLQDWVVITKQMFKTIRIVESPVISKFEITRNIPDTAPLPHTARLGGYN